MRLTIGLFVLAQNLVDITLVSFTCDLIDGKLCGLILIRWNRYNEYK